MTNGAKSTTSNSFLFVTNLSANAIFRFKIQAANVRLVKLLLTLSSNDLSVLSPPEQHALFDKMICFDFDETS